MIVRSALELLARIGLDAGDRLVSLTGLSTPTQFWEPQLVGLDDIDRQISVQPGEFRAAEFAVQLDNSGNAWSDIRTNEALMGRTIEILLGDVSIGWSDFTVIATGVISDWSADAATFTITAEDISLNRLDQVIDDRINPTTFPDLPDETPRELVPLVVGLVSSAGTGQSNTGALPCYLIDPAITSAKYVYVACQREVKDIPNVYLFGVVVGSGFTIETRTYGGLTYTTIEFDADQRDATRSDPEITCDGDGITDDGTASGNRISNPARIWEQVLLSNGFVAGDIDAASVTAAEGTYAGRSITGGFASVSKDETLRDIAEKFAESFNLTTLATRAGLIGMSVPNPGAAVSPSIVSIDESQIVRDSFEMRGSEDLAAGADFFFAPNWHLDLFDLTGSRSDAHQEAQLNADIRESFNLPYVRNISSAAAVVNDKLFFRADERVLIEAQVDAALLRSVDVGDTITFKHYTGIPFSPTAFRVLGAGLGFDDPAMVLNLSLIDISIASLTFGTRYLAKRAEADPMRTNHARPRRPGTGTGLGVRWH